MINVLRILFVFILVAMIAVTSYASLHIDVFSGAAQLVATPWGLATLFDAYFAFITFYVWVFYRERTSAARLIWFVLIMALGNIAMAAYVLIGLYRLPPGSSLEQLLKRREQFS